MTALWLKSDITAKAAGQLGGRVLLHRRLIGDLGVFDAIDAFGGAATAEAELARRRVADRPFAHVGAERQDRGRAGLLGGTLYRSRGDRGGRARLDRLDPARGRGLGRRSGAGARGAEGG